MARIGGFEGVENPEQSKPPETGVKPVVPSEIDKKKLERPSGNLEIKPSGEAQSKIDGKEKLGIVRPKEESLDNKKPENVESTMNDYFKDLKNRSECPETIRDRPFESRDLKKLSPEETAAKRDEFDDKKPELKNSGQRKMDGLGLNMMRMFIPLMEK